MFPEKKKSDFNCLSSFHPHCLYAIFKKLFYIYYLYTSFKHVIIQCRVWPAISIYYLYWIFSLFTMKGFTPTLMDMCHNYLQDFQLASWWCSDPSGMKKKNSQSNNATRTKKKSYGWQETYSAINNWSNWFLWKHTELCSRYVQTICHLTWYENNSLHIHYYHCFVFQCCISFSIFCQEMFLERFKEQFHNTK